MAEAVVDGSPISRFFCHKCAVEIERLLPDYTCPNCASGFIEKLEDTEDDDDDVDMVGFNTREMDRIYFEIGMMERARSLAENSGIISRRRRDSLPNGASNAHPRTPFRQETLLHELIVNLTGVQRQIAPTTRRQSVLFLGNPGDYVWGRDGLDTIVTELLNQLDGSGPPPLSRSQIDEIPTTAIVQSNIDLKLQCSICWEDFILAEIVRQLPCNHLFHTPCIVPWLELHGTCPICRQNLGDQNAADEMQSIHDDVYASLAHFFRVTNQSNDRNSATSSTSTGNDSGNSPSNEI